MEPGVAVMLFAALVAAAPAGEECGTTSQNARDLEALHAYAAQLGPARAYSVPDDVDEDAVAILHDRDDLIIRRNAFDLDGASLRLLPNRRGGYDAARLALALDAASTPLLL